MTYKEFIRKLFNVEDDYDGCNNIEFSVDENLLYEELSNVRRPHYRCRGKKLSREDAMQFLKDNDGSIDSYVDYVGKRRSITAKVPWYLLCNWFSRNSWSSGWIRSDGTVGADECCGIKYPELEEYLYGFISTYEAYPQLDVIWAFSNWDERSPKYWELLSMSNDTASAALDENREMTTEEQAEYNRLEKLMEAYEDEGFEDSIIFGIFMHDGKFELLSASRAQEVYKEYNSKYACDNTDSYSVQYVCDNPQKCAYASEEVLRELLSMRDLTQEEIGKCVNLYLKGIQYHTGNVTLCCAK